MIQINLGQGLRLKLDDWTYTHLCLLQKRGTSFRRIKARDRYYCEFTAVDNQKYLVHRFLMNQHTKEFVIDHKDGNGLNNQYNNLRHFNYSNNMLHRRKFAGYKTTTKLHHISYKRRAKSFYVRIVKDTKEYSKGGFRTIEDAIEYHKVVLPKLYPEIFQTIFEENGYVAKA